MTKWVVVGGGGAGILVRKGKETTTEAESAKLATGAVVEELERSGARLKFKKVSGAGPTTGWVSVESSGKALLQQVTEEDGGPAVEALSKVVAGCGGDAALQAFKGLADKKSMGAGTLLSVIPDLYLKEKSTASAVTTGEEAVAHFKSSGDKIGEAMAQNTLATAYFHQQDYEKAREAAEAALDTFTQVGDMGGQASVMHTLIGINLVSSHKDDARRLAKEATKLFRLTKDVKGQASAAMLEAEVYIECSRLDAAAGAAKEAAELFEQIGDKKQEAAALILLAFADLNTQDGASVGAAEKAVTLYQELGDQVEEAGATYALANAHLSALSVKQRHCLLPSKQNTLGALTAAKAAYQKFSDTDNSRGMAAATAMMQNALAVNGVEERDVDPRADTGDMMASIQREAERLKEAKKPEKSGGLTLNRQKFGWRDETSNYHYVLVWQHAVENLGMRRGGYKSVMFGGADRCHSLPMYHNLKCHFNGATTDEGPLAVHISSIHSSWQYGTNIMQDVNTVSTMMTCKLAKYVFIQMHESPPDADEWMHRQRVIARNAVTLGIIRSARLENPTTMCGYIAIDTPTWNNNRLEVVQAIPDVVLTEESELMFRRGSPLCAALVQQDIEQACSFTKTAQMNAMH